MSMMNDDYNPNELSSARDFLKDSRHEILAENVLLDEQGRFVVARLRRSYDTQWIKIAERCLQTQIFVTFQEK